MARAKTREKLPTRKISETFLDFAEPLLTPLGAEAARRDGGSAANRLHRVERRGV